MWNIVWILAIISTSLVFGTHRDSRCVYFNKNYDIGDTWTTIEGCNHCKCTVNGMICTAYECNLKQFAKPNEGSLDCNSEGDWYDWHEFWKLKDGCNTCYCLMPGNFRGQQICTTTNCSSVNTHVG